MESELSVDQKFGRIICSPDLIVMDRVHSALRLHEELDRLDLEGAEVEVDSFLIRVRDNVKILQMLL